MPKPILLVDDDPNIRDTACDILQDAGFDTRTADTGQSALVALEESQAALVLTDFNLPDMKGIDLARQIEKIRPEVVLVIMTGEQSPDLGTVSHNVRAVLIKPVLPSDLIALIKKLLDD